MNPELRNHFSIVWTINTPTTMPSHILDSRCLDAPDAPDIQYFMSSVASLTLCQRIFIALLFTSFTCIVCSMVRGKWSIVPSIYCWFFQLFMCINFIKNLHWDLRRTMGARRNSMLYYHLNLLKWISRSLSVSQRRETHPKPFFYIDDLCLNTKLKLNWIV